MFIASSCYIYIKYIPQPFLRDFKHLEFTPTDVISKFVRMGEEQKLNPGRNRDEGILQQRNS